MSERRRHQPERETTDEPRRRWFNSVYTAELAIGVTAALVLFLLLLWVLDLGLPTGTGLGELVRAPQDAGTRATNLGFETQDGRPLAVLADVRRDVRQKPASSVVWGSASAGTKLGDRHAVQTYDNSGASIRFGDKQWLELGENSVIVVREPRSDTGSLRRRAAVLFMDGFVRGRLAPAGENDTEVEFIAAGATIRASGDDAQQADIELAMGADGAAISVLDGSAELVWGDEVTTLPSGHMVTYDPETGPGTPEPLPRPPRLKRPSHGARYRYRQAPPPVTFDWRSGGDGQDYRLQIARDPEFEQVVLDQRLAERSFVHGNLDSGDYYWRVFQHRGMMASLPTPTRHLVVERHAVAPPLTVRLPDGPVKQERIRVRGTTEPSCRVLIGDVSVPVDADGNFEHELTLQHGYNFLVVQAVDTAGNAAFRNQTILADLASPKRAP